MKKTEQLLSKLSDLASKAPEDAQSLVKQLESGIKDVGATLESFSTENEEKRQTISDLESQKRDLQTSKQDLEKQVETLETQVNEGDPEKEQLQAEIQEYRQYQREQLRQKFTKHQESPKFEKVHEKFFDDVTIDEDDGPQVDALEDDQIKQYLDKFGELEDLEYFEAPDDGPPSKRKMNGTVRGKGSDDEPKPPETKAEMIDSITQYVKQNAQ